MSKRAVLARGGDKARRSSGRAPVKAAEGRGWARRIVRKWAKQPVMVGHIKLVKWVRSQSRPDQITSQYTSFPLPTVEASVSYLDDNDAEPRTSHDAELALTAAQASNQPLTRALRSQLGYSLPAAEALPDDLYSRNHHKKAQQAAHDPNSATSPAHALGGRAAHVKHEPAAADGPASDLRQPQLAVTLHVDAAAHVTVVLAAVAAKREHSGEADQSADAELGVKKEEAADDDADAATRRVGFEASEEEEEEADDDDGDDKAEAEDDEAKRRDDMEVEAEAEVEGEAEDDKEDEDDEAEDDEKEQPAEQDADGDQPKPHPDSPQSPTSDSDSGSDADERSPAASSRPLALPLPDEPSLPSLLPLPIAATATAVPIPSPLLPSKDDDEVMREMDAHAWGAEHTGSGELGQHDLPAGEVDGDEPNAAMTDDM